MTEDQKQLKAARKALWIKRREVTQLRGDVDELKAVAAARMEQLRRKGEINDRLVTEVEDLKAELREAKREQDRLQLAKDAANHAADVMQRETVDAAERVTALTARVEELESENWALRDQIERFNERAGYPVDVDPVIAERLREQNRLLKEEIRVKTVWIADLVQRIKEFRAESRALAEIAETQADVADAIVLVNEVGGESLAGRGD